MHQGAELLPCLKAEGKAEEKPLAGCWCRSAGSRHTLTTYTNSILRAQKAPRTDSPADPQLEALVAKVHARVLDAHQASAALTPTRAVCSGRGLISPVLRSRTLTKHQEQAGGTRRCWELRLSARSETSCSSQRPCMRSRSWGFSLLLIPPAGSRAAPSSHQGCTPHPGERT